MQILQSMQHTLSHISNNLEAITHGTLFGKLLISAGAVLTAYFTPILGLLLTCFSTTIVDMLYGFKLANRQHIKITSDKNRKGTLTKMRDEFVIICLARIVEFTVIGTSGVFVLTGGVTAIIALTEIWSILETLNTLNPDGPWRTLSKFLKKKGEDYTGIDLDTNDNNNSSNCLKKDNN